MKMLCERCRRTIKIIDEDDIEEWGICPECYEDEKAFERRQHGKTKA
jgi:hypothetical protein